MSISGNLVGTYTSLGKTFIFVDEDGNELTGVCVDNPVMFTAGDNDVREGFTYASDNGASTGTKNIPSYRTTCGRWGIFPGESLSIPLSQYKQYDYTELQCIIAEYNTTMLNSVATMQVVLNSNIYNVNSSDSIAVVTKNKDTQSIDFNFINNSDKILVIHYFTYREEP